MGRHSLPDGSPTERTGARPGRPPRAPSSSPPASCSPWPRARSWHCAAVCSRSAGRARAVGAARRGRLARYRPGARSGGQDRAARTRRAPTAAVWTSGSPRAPPTRSPTPSDSGRSTPTSRSGCRTRACGWTGSTAERGTPLTAVGTIASSPVALGAVPSAAKSLGWPEKTYTWTQLARAATSGDAAAPGRRRPGPQRHRAARPGPYRRRQRQGGTKDSDEADTRTAATAKLLYQRVTDGDGQVLATLPRDNSGAEQGNPRRNQALLLSEQAAFAHNTTRGRRPRSGPVLPPGRHGPARLPVHAGRRHAS